MILFEANKLKYPVCYSPFDTKFVFCIIALQIHHKSRSASPCSVKRKKETASASHFHFSNIKILFFSGFSSAYMSFCSVSV